MLLAHLSDLHLGHRAWGRRRGGVDVREEDVAVAFRRAADALVRLRPDVILVAGDVFDRPDPSPSATVVLGEVLARIRDELPAAPVLLLAGPRDTPLRPGQPGPLALFDTLPGVTAATGAPRAVEVGDGRCRVVLAPWAGRTRRPPALPGPEGRTPLEVLAAHGRPPRGTSDGGVGGWNWLALGGPHVRGEAGSTAAWPGSLERVGYDPWSEAGEEKGFLTVDLERARAAFHPLPARAVVSLAPIRVDPDRPGSLPERLREVTDEVPGGIDDRIVRLRIRGLAPEDLATAEPGLLEGLRERALHLAIRLERTPSSVAPGPSLDDRLRAAAADVDPRVGRRVERLLRSAGEEPETPEGEAGVGGPRKRRGSVVPERGVAGVFGGSSEERRRLLRRVADGPPRIAAPPGTGDLERLLDRLGHEAVAAGKQGRVLRALEAVEARQTGQGPPAPGAPTGGGAADRAGAPEQVRAAQRELRSLRADAAEVQGDVEVATMDWLRERQDAETQLQGYRDRARELKSRLRQIEGAGSGSPCPTCGRLLDDRFAGVVSQLRDEWEAVVQDGRWWKRRREQLEEKPEELRTLELRSVRLHAAIEQAAERLERLRSGGGGEGRSPREETESREGALDREAARLLRRLLAGLRREARQRLLAGAGVWLERVTDGRLLALEVDPDGAVLLRGDGGTPRSPSPEDRAVGALALVLALERPVGSRGDGRGRKPLVLGDGFRALSTDDALRALRLLGRSRGGGRPVLVSLREEWAGRVRERLERTVEVGGRGPGKVRIRRAGTARVRLPAQ